MSSRVPIAYASVRTLFLDVGHTLIAPDFAWMASELAVRGVECSAAELARADAELRPHLGVPPRDSAGELTNGRIHYLDRLFARLSESSARANPRRAELVRELVPILYPGGTGERLWSCVMAGVREALARFARLGLRMVVVSNADGTVEKVLVEKELHFHFAAVIDSHVVGAAKPDPTIFEIALARSGAERQHTLHVGDMYDADVLGARSAGLAAVLLDPAGSWGPRDCDAFPDLSALADRLEREHTTPGARV
jgi:putative hydrolase of the HAD superfamily